MGPVRVRGYGSGVVGTRRRRRESSLRWLSAALTPWMVGLGLLVSFTADAGTENAIGASRLGVIEAGTVPPLPPGTLLIGSALRRLGDEPPQAVFKTGAHVFPVVQRGGKGNPARPPAESFARRAAIPAGAPEAPWCSATSPAASAAC